MIYIHMTRKETIIVIVSILVIIAGFLLYYKNRPQGQDVDVNSSLHVGPVVGYLETKTNGLILTDKMGMTLYAYGDDKKLESVCEGDCLKQWKVFEFDNQYGDKWTDTLSRSMNIIDRKDGWKQYAFGERPVYYYKGDLKIGDTNGNGLEGGKWSIINVTAQ